MFHLSEDGPRPCGARPGHCPLGGEHYENRAEAQKSFEEKQEGPGVLSKSMKLLEPLELARISDEKSKEILDRFDSMAKVLMQHDNEGLADARAFLVATIEGRILEDLPAAAKSNFALSSALKWGLMEAGAYATATLHNARGIKAVVGNGTVLDLMAGRGFMAKALREVGVKTIATDDDSWGISSQFEKLDALEAIDKYGHKITHVLIAWAPYESTIDHKILEYCRNNYPELTIIYIGESRGGCTGSELFWEDAEEQGEIDLTYETLAVNRDFVAYVK